MHADSRDIVVGQCGLLLDGWIELYVLYFVDSAYEYNNNNIYFAALKSMLYWPQIC